MKTIEVISAVISGDKIMVTRGDYGDFENMWWFLGEIEYGEYKKILDMN